jgi:hypothetical protein
LRDGCGRRRYRSPVLADPSVFKAALVPDEFTFQNEAETGRFERHTLRYDTV